MRKISYRYDFVLRIQIMIIVLLLSLFCNINFCTCFVFQQDSQSVLWIKPPTSLSSSLSCLNLHPPNGFGGGGSGGSTTNLSSKKKKEGKVKKKQSKSASAQSNPAVVVAAAVANNSKRKLTTTTPSKTSTTTVYRKDYSPPPYRVTNVNLDFNIIDETLVRITSLMTVVVTQPKKNLNFDENGILLVEDLILDGDATILDLKHMSISSTKADGSFQTLKEGRDYERTSDTLRIKNQVLKQYFGNRNDNDKLRLRTIVELTSFDKGSELSGLYVRDEMFVTHCEPTGFRQITYFVDRPDNTAIFDEVRIEASKMKYPLLLTNGNCIESGDIDSRHEQQEQRHYVIYNDPYPKPCYIFGLIASKELEYLSDSYTTSSGRNVDLRIYTTETQSLSKLQFALETVKKSMEWDETSFGLEYDLDTYNVIAAQHFKLGAMENKGLNIFQTSLIATNPQLTTDITYDLVEKTIAHEYFHNWSGNRVTIQSWFEFTLKEGLTVYRDQEFTADVGLKTITRIEAVKILREKQFREDASNERHPIRPESARSSREHSLDALASSTTYHKGAEVCRMYKSILGKEGFRKGLRLYTDRHDGTGVTCDDFRNAMADANGVDLDQFALWYSTAGTPTVSYQYSYDDKSQTFSLKLTQHLVHGKDDVLLHIPVSVGLLDKVSREEVVKTTTLSLKDRTQTFDFPDLPNDVVPSILRDFSAPVILVNENDGQTNEEDEALSFLATYDTDWFNRWEAIQQLYSKCIYKMMESDRDEDGVPAIQSRVMMAFKNTFDDPTIDYATKSYLLSLPTEAILSRQLQIDSPDGVHRARQELGKQIRSEFKAELQELYKEMTQQMALNDGEEVPTDTTSRAKRALRNVLLDFLCFVDNDDEESTQQAAATLAMKHLDDSVCLTDRLAAFRKLSSMTGAASHARDVATTKFYEFAKEINDPVVMHKWFQTQALSDVPGVLDRVKALTQHPDFKATNAGRFRSLLTSFTMNANAFHCRSGEGYKFIGSIISQIDRVAPELAIELANKLALWKRQDPTRGAMMKAELKRIASTKATSKGLAITVQRAVSSS